MTITLEQQRGADAWQRSQGCSKEYVNLSKGLPALIMNSGLMQVMAFLHEKSGGDRRNKQQHCADLGEHLRAWLRSRFPEVIKKDGFPAFMEALLKAEPATYQQITAEAYAWLRWVRQMAPAVHRTGL